MNKIIRRSVLNQITEQYLQFKGKQLLNGQIVTPNNNIGYVTFLSETQHVSSLSNQYYQLPKDCYDSTLSFDQAVDVVRTKRQKQDQKFGVDKPQSLAGFMLILQHKINEATHNWYQGNIETNDPLSSIVDIAAVAIACIEKYGDKGNTISTNDTIVSSESPNKVTLVNGPTIVVE